MAIFLSFTGHLLFSFSRGIVPTKNETINVGSSGVIAFSPFFPTRHEPCPCFMTPGLLSAHEFHLDMEFCLLNLFLRPYMQCYCEKRPCLNQEVNRCACSISCDLKPRILPSFRAILRYFLYLGNRAYEHYPLYTIEFDKSNPKVSRGGGWVNYHSYQLSLFLCLPFVVEGLPTTQRKRKQESWSFLRWILRERVTLERRKMKHDNCS